VDPSHGTTERFAPSLFEMLHRRLDNYGDIATLDCRM